MSAHTSQLWFINLVSSPTENKRHYIALHCSTLYCTALHCITLHYIPLHTITYHYIPLHAMPCHYITLHYICITYHTTTYNYIPRPTTTYITCHYSPLQGCVAMMFDEGKYRDNSFFNLLDMFLILKPCMDVYRSCTVLYGKVAFWKQFENNIYSLYNKALLHTLRSFAWSCHYLLWGSAGRC